MAKQPKKVQSPLEKLLKNMDKGLSNNCIDLGEKFALVFGESPTLDLKAIDTYAKLAAAQAKIESDAEIAEEQAQSLPILAMSPEEIAKLAKKAKAKSKAKSNAKAKNN